jgi:hypothetical protein
MRLILLSFILLFVYSCKSREKPAAPTEEQRRYASGYSVDTLKTLNQYIGLLSHRKLRTEHYCYTVISNVTVVDVKLATTTPFQTVILHEGKIERILAAGEIRPEISKDYRVLEIDGKGRYLAPGLCDMHVHYACANVLRLNFLLNGVTTIRNAGGQKVHFDEQRMLVTQQILGPNLYSTFEAKEIPWIRDSAYTPNSFSPTWISLNGKLTTASLDSAFSLAEKNKLHVSIDSWNPLPEYSYEPGTAFEQWTGFTSLQRLKNFESFWFFAKFYQDSASKTFNKMRTAVLQQLKHMPDRFCIGTETQKGNSQKSNPVVDEMRALSSMGVDNATVIRIATYNAGIFINGDAQPDTSRLYPALFGEVKEGFRADLVLLAGNPLAQNYGSPQLVFINGVCLSETDLAEMRDAAIKFSWQ